MLKCYRRVQCCPGLKELDDEGEGEKTWWESYGVVETLD